MSTNSTMPSPLLSLLAGALFGAGLVISGMAEPGKVLAFLHLGPGWDASLAFVMGSALAITVPGFWWLRKTGRTPATERGRIDAPLLIGAGLFGLGWGIAGYCPGPALVAFSQGSGGALWLVPAMFAGQWLADLVSRGSSAD